MINDKTLTWTFFLIDILVLWVLYYTGNIIFIIDNDISNIAIIIISIYFVSNLLFFKMAFSKATYLPDLEYIKNIVIGHTKLLSKNLSILRILCTVFCIFFS